jgi:hypothetical protein
MWNLTPSFLNNLPNSLSEHLSPLEWARGFIQTRHLNFLASQKTKIEKDKSVAKINADSGTERLSNGREKTKRKVVTIIGPNRFLKKNFIVI